MDDPSAAAIHPAEPDDVHALGTLLREGHEDAPSSDRAQRELPEDPFGAGRELVDLVPGGEERVLVAELDEAIAGFAALIERELVRSSHVAELVLLVHPLVRGRGLGARLARAAVEAARLDPGLRKLSARVADDDEALRRSIAAAGPWERERVERGALARGEVDHDLHVHGLWLPRLNEDTERRSASDAPLVEP